MFALGLLAALLRSLLGATFSMPWPMPGAAWMTGGSGALFLLFIGVWLTIWTVGGVAAITEVLRSVAGEDILGVRGSAVELVRRAGPFTRTRIFDRAAIRRVRSRPHDTAVVLDGPTGTEVLSRFGTPAERQEVAAWLRRQLSLPEEGFAVDPTTAPPGWTMTVEGGTTRLTDSNPRTRRAGVLTLWAIVVLLVLVAYGSLQAGTGALAPLAMAVPFAAYAVWLTESHKEWLVRDRRLSRRTRFAIWSSERTFHPARLELTRSVDSDNDAHYQLKVVDDHGHITIAREMNDDAGLLDLGRWLAARTGLELRS